MFLFILCFYSSCKLNSNLDSTSKTYQLVSLPYTPQVDTLVLIVVRLQGAGTSYVNLNMENIHLGFNVANVDTAYVNSTLYLKKNITFSEVSKMNINYLVYALM